MSAEDPMHSSQGAPGDDGQRILATGSDIADLAAQVPRTLASILGTWVDVVALVLEDVFEDARQKADLQLLSIGYPGDVHDCVGRTRVGRSEEHTSELQSHSFISY